jgi:hypothetical protein
MSNVKSQTLQKLWSLYIQNNSQQSTDELIISVVNQLKNQYIDMMYMEKIWYIVCGLIRNGFEDTYTTIPIEIQNKLCDMMEQKWFKIIDKEVRNYIDNEEEVDNLEEDEYEQLVLETKQNWSEDYWEGCKDVYKGDRQPWGIELREIIDLGPELCLSIIKDEEFDWNSFWFDFESIDDFNFGVFTSILIGKIK